MSQRSPDSSLHDMLTYACKAVQFCANKTKSEFEQDEVLQLAATRAVEIIGEAAARIPADIQGQNPAIPWKDIIGSRHRLIHGYDRVDLDIVWTTIQDDLPTLVDQLRNLLGVE
jgi:uncharacterized protein with HEPN domain